MIRYLSLVEVLTLHRRIIEQSGGGLGIRNLGLLESAIALSDVRHEALLEY